MRLIYETIKILTRSMTQFSWKDGRGLTMEIFLRKISSDSLWTIC